MCVILPVDHLPCTHTVAIWQHCIAAPKSRAYGLEPCRRIRQHSRPILTRKKCINCGGPRFFARRGGIADRGTGSIDPIEETEEEYDVNDLRYHSDVIHEEEEEDDDDDDTLSPRASRPPAKSFKPKLTAQDIAAKMLERRRMYQSPSRQSWRPNLKRDLSSERSSTPTRRESIDSHASSFIEDGIGRANHRHWPSLDGAPRSVPSTLDTPASSTGRPVLPTLDTTLQRSPPPRRKSSTLLHPSPPPEETTTDPAVSPAFSILPPSAQEVSLPGREPSTLLRSSPLKQTVSPLQQAINSPSLASTITPHSPVPNRKNSTLLHPSSPLETHAMTQLKGFPFPSPLPTPPSSAHSASSSTATTPGFFIGNLASLERRSFSSIIHSSQSDTASIYSRSEYSNAHNDYESDSLSSYNHEEQQEPGDAASFHFQDVEDRREVEEESDVIMAQSARMARASRIQSYGAQWRAVDVAV